MLRRRPEIDFDAEPLHGLNDAGVLDLAAREDRLLVTHDVSTIPPLFYSLYGKVDLPGVILVPQNFPIGSTIERLDQIWQVARAEDWRGRLCYLPSVSDFMA